MLTTLVSISAVLLLVLLTADAWLLVNSVKYMGKLVTTVDVVVASKANVPMIRVGARLPALQLHSARSTLTFPPECFDGTIVIARSSCNTCDVLVQGIVDDRQHVPEGLLGDLTVILRSPSGTRQTLHSTDFESVGIQNVIDTSGRVMLNWGIFVVPTGIGVDADGKITDITTDPQGIRSLAARPRGAMVAANTQRLESNKIGVH
jgi:hypothetical protein